MDQGGSGVGGLSGRVHPAGWATKTRAQTAEVALIMLSVGSGTSGTGGSVQGFAGRTQVVTGGALSFASGEGTATTSGMVTIRSVNAGDHGSSRPGMAPVVISHRELSAGGDDDRHLPGQ